MPEQSPVFHRRQQGSAKSAEESQMSMRCCGCFRSHCSGRVAPLPGEYFGYDIVEVRPGRFLRVIHIKPGSRRPKNAHLSNKMTVISSSNNNQQPQLPDTPHPKKYQTVLNELQNSAKFSKDGSELTSLGATNVTFDAQEDKHASLPANSTGEPPTTTTNIKDCQNARVSLTDTNAPSSPKLSKQFRIIAGSAVDLSPKRKQPNSSHSKLNTLPLSAAEKRVRTASGVHCHLEAEGRTNAAFANDQDIEIHSVDGETQEEDILDNAHDQISEGEKLHKVTNSCSPHHGPSGDAQCPSKPVIFLIHGVGGSADVWQAQIDHFSSNGYEIVAADFVGHGFSCAPKQCAAYDFAEIKRDTMAVFDKYCKRQNIVIGHSYG